MTKSGFLTDKVSYSKEQKIDNPQNKILLIIPWHRVIRSDGTVGGFSSIGSVNLKKKLLEFENLWNQ